MGDKRTASGALFVTVEFAGDLCTYLHLRKQIIRYLRPVTVQVGCIPLSKGQYIKCCKLYIISTKSHQENEVEGKRGDKHTLYT